MDEIYWMIAFSGGSVIGAFFFALYILRSVGLWTIARRRGISGAWLAWVPIFRSFVIGGISDQYRQVVRGRKGWLRWVILFVDVLTVMVVPATVVLVVEYAVYALLSGITLGFFVVLVQNEFRLLQELLPVLVCGSVIVLVIHGLICCVAKCNLYRSCNPKRWRCYLLLDILIPFSEPFILFACREKDHGMIPEEAEGNIS